MRCVVAVPGCSPARRDTPTVAPPGSCPLPRGGYQPRGGVAGLDPACLCRRPGQLHLSLVRTRRSGTRACWPRPARRVAWSSWLLVLAPRRPGGRRRPPAKARSQLLAPPPPDGSDAGVLSRPGPLLQSAHDHDPAALRQRLGGVLGLVAPHHDGEERRLLLPTARHGPPEPGPEHAPLG